MGQTVVVRRELPRIISEYDVTSLLDIPCGDLHWISQITLPQGTTYIGADIVPQLIAANREKYPHIDTRVLDIVTDSLPKSDLVLVRDLFGHLTNQEVTSAIENIRRSGSRLLLTTTFPNMPDSVGRTGGWRPINMNYFGLTPIELVDEELLREDGVNVGKMLGLYYVT